MAENHHYSSDGPICPHCGHTDNPDEAFYYDEDTTELECGECYKAYDVRVYNSTSWATSLPDAALSLLRGGDNA